MPGVHDEIVPIGVANLITHRIECFDGDWLLAREMGQIRPLLTCGTIALQTFPEQSEKRHHIRFAAAQDEMNVIAHNLEGDDLNARAIVSAHRNQRHRKRIVFRSLEDDGLLFARRTKMPYAAILLNRPFKNPPAPIFLLEEGMLFHFLCHLFLHLNANATMALDKDKDTSTKPGLQVFCQKVSCHPHLSLNLRMAGK